MLSRRIYRQFACGFYSIIALFFFFSTDNAASADLMPMFVDVNFNSTASQVYSNQGAVAGITFLPNPTWRQWIAPGINAGTSVTIRTFISPTAKSGETFTFTNRPFDLIMKLKDEPSGASGTLTFAGTFSGTLSMQSSQIFAAINSPLLQHLRLGNDYYTVNLGTTPPYIDEPGLNYVMPGPPSSPLWRGGIGASISMQVIPRTPEPSSLVLAGLGVLGLAARFGWRRTRVKIA
jgi:hypothetical protein